MICKFIVAIDRSQSIEDAFENVELAHTLRTNSHFTNRLVGMDLGGNPTRNPKPEIFSMISGLPSRRREIMV